MWRKEKGRGKLTVSLAPTASLWIVLYVTSLPRSTDYGSASTAVLLTVLITGCLAIIPSWLGCFLVIVGGKGRPNEPPPHARMLRHCVFAALVRFFRCSK